MTFDPQHDYEDESSAKFRFKGALQQPVPCPCHLCRMFDLDEGPMLVPAMQTLPDGRRRYTGRWLHGAALRLHLTAKRRVSELRHSFSGYAMGER